MTRVALITLESFLSSKSREPYALLEFLSCVFHKMLLSSKFDKYQTSFNIALTLRRIREPTDLLKEQLPESLSINFFKFITAIRVIEINS